MSTTSAISKKTAFAFSAEHPALLALAQGGNTKVKKPIIPALPKTSLKKAAAAKPEAKKTDLKKTLPETAETPAAATDDNTVFMKEFLKPQNFFVWSQSGVDVGINKVGIDPTKFSNKYKIDFALEDKQKLKRQTELFQQNFDAVKKCYDDNFKSYDDVVQSDSKLRQCVDGEDILNFKRRFFYNQNFYSNTVRGVIAGVNTILASADQSVDSKEKDTNLLQILAQRLIPEVAEHSLRIDAVEKSGKEDALKALDGALKVKNDATLHDQAKTEATAETSTWGGWISNLFSSQAEIEDTKYRMLHSAQKQRMTKLGEDQNLNTQYQKDFLTKASYSDPAYIWQDAAE